MQFFIHDYVSVGLF